MTPAERIEAIPAAIGAGTVDALAYLGSLARLSGKSAYLTFIGPFKGKPFRPRRAIHAAMEVGVEAIPIVSLISILFGLILALQMAHELATFGMLKIVPDVVIVAMIRELGPLVTAIIVIGRSGSAFAAEIGTKQVTEEVDALRTMSFDPVGFLAAPKFLAMLVMLPALTTWSNLMGSVGGCIFGLTGGGFTVPGYFKETLAAIVIGDVVTGFVKSVVFSVVITAVGCQEGFGTGGGPEEVGRSTTSAVVKAIFLVILVDMIFTSIFYITKGS
jgi:phospholipid/cholesterol/gamma-HCH transport system permease protein